MTRITKLSQPESVADFKLRLAALMRGLKPDAVVGAAHAHPSVVRKTNKKGKP